MSKNGSQKGQKEFPDIYRWGKESSYDDSPYGDSYNPGSGRLYVELQLAGFRLILLYQFPCFIVELQFEPGKESLGKVRNPYLRGLYANDYCIGMCLQEGNYGEVLSNHYGPLIRILFRRTDYLCNSLALDESGGVVLFDDEEDFGVLPYIPQGMALRLQYHVDVSILIPVINLRTPGFSIFPPGCQGNGIRIRKDAQVSPYLFSLLHTRKFKCSSKDRLMPFKM